MKSYHIFVVFAFIIGLIFVQSCKEDKPIPPEKIKPQTPKNLEATAQSAEQIQLTWIDDSENEARFHIERSESNNQNFQKIATVDQNVNAYKDSKLKPSTVYFYRIQAATSADVLSEYSNEVKAQTENNLEKPMGLRAEANSAREVQLLWIDNNDKETAYKVERSVSDESNFVEIAVLDFNITSYKDTDVQEKTKYFYRIQAVNIIGKSPYSDVAVAETPEDKPNTPKKLTIVPLSTTEVKATWEDVSDDESFFELERAKNEPRNFELVETISANAVSVINRGLEPATTYYYRLRARRNLNIYSEYTETVKVTTNVLPPNPPKNLKAKALSPVSVSLTWTDDSSNELGFQIFRSEDLNGIFLEIGQVTTNTTEYQDNAVKSNTTYYYKIKAFNSTDVSTFSQVIAVATPDYPPSAPSDLVANVISGYAIVLTWVDNSTNESAFVLEKSIDNKNFELVSELNVNVTRTEVIGLVPNTTYYFRLKSSNAVGNSDYTNIVTAKTLQVIPAKPINISVRGVSSSKLNITWTDNSNNETGFIIYRSSSHLGPFVEIVRVKANVTSYLDKDLKSNDQYYYQVVSYNEKGTSDVSNPVAGYTSDGRPTTPNLMKLNAISAGKVEMTYQETSTEASKVILEVSEKNANNFVKHTEFESKEGQQTQIVSNLHGGTLYYFRIRTTNGKLYSGYSSILSITTTVAPPVAPSEFSALATSSSSIALKWKDNSKDEVGFTIERSINGVSFVVLANLGKNVSTYTDNGLVQNATYFYRIISYNAVGKSVRSKVVKAETPIKGGPLKPSSISLKASESPLSVQINWKDNSDNETGFRIERRTTSGNYKIIASVLTNTTNYTDVNIVGNTTYYYRVSAYNNVANSSPTKEKSTTVYAVLTPPYGVTGTYTSSPQKVVLSWQMLNYESLSKNNALDGFRVERSENSNKNFLVVKNLKKDTLTYTDTNITAGRIYYYRIKAYNRKGYSDASAEWAVQAK